VARSAVGRDDFRQRADGAVLVLFASVIESMGWATAALLERDLDVADRVITGDREIDELCDGLMALVKERLASGEVDAQELKDLIVLLQMVPELERSVELAEHIALRARVDLGGTISPRCRGLIQSMCDAGISMWQLSSRAYAERSPDLGLEADASEHHLDSLSASMLRECAADAVDPAVAAELSLVARYYERLGDHAVNLARQSATMSKRGLSNRGMSNRIAAGDRVVPH